MRADFAFLDSGTGGIPYMLDLKKKNPAALCVYLGDTGHFPYGEKSPSEVLECASESVSLIRRRWNPRTLVIACNTISVAALRDLRLRFPDLPIVGTVPAIRLAARVSRNRRIGFLATNATVSHPYSQRLIDDYAGDCRVFRRGDPDLVSFIENSFFRSTAGEKTAACLPSIEFFRKNCCDTVILGCTHFTHIADLYQRLCGGQIRVVDSRDGVSNQAIRVEEGNPGPFPPGNDSGFGDFEDLSFFVTAASEIQAEEYRALCEKCSIPWGGVV